MATSERQKIYNQLYREKQAKIKRLCQELDAGVVALEKLGQCPPCQSAGERIGLRVQCTHTPERHKQLRELELVRAQLEQIDH